MIPKSIIDKAVEGGFYLPKDVTEEWGGTLTYDTECRIVLDPLFWQALEKMGQRINNDEYPTWVVMAMDFFHFTLRKQNTEQFWHEVLSSKNL